MERIAIYPGTFDPPTNGHVDIIKRSVTIFDKVVVAILHNPNKKFLFSVKERIEMLQVILKDFPNVEVDMHDGLLVDYASKRKAIAVIRGMRAVSDFEYEFQLALMNRSLNRNVQTVFLMTSLSWIFISSSVVKEAARFGGDVSSMVPPFVYKKLTEKYRPEQEPS